MLQNFLHKVALGIVGVAALVSSLFGGGNQANFGATVPIVVSVFQTSLASAIASTDTSMTMVLGTDRAGTTLSGYYCFTLDAGTAIQEFVCGTVAGTAVSSMIRGIDPQNPNTSVTALKFAHRRGAEVKITDYPQLAIISRIINGTDTLPNILSYNSAPSFTTGLQIVDKTYVDGVAVAGASNADTTTKGIVQEATVSQLNAGTATGSTGAILVGSPADFASSIFGTQLPSSGQKSALVGNNTDIAVGSGNKFITQTGLQHSAETYALDSSVSANTITVTLSPVPTSYTNGMAVRVKVANSVTGATTINVNSLGAKNVTKNGTTALVSGDITASQLVTLVYDGTEFQLQNGVQTLYKSGVTTRDCSAASNSVTIAHGLGAIPKFIRINAQLVVSTGQIIGSTGVYNGTTTSTIYEKVTSTTYASGSDTTNVFRVENNTGNDGSNCVATATFDATNITLTFTKSANATGTAQILWEAYGGF